MVEFLIVYAPSPYNCILGQPALNQLQANVSTYDLSMEVPNSTDVQMIYGDQRACPRMLLYYCQRS